jgi:hypothetical protein
VSGWTTPADLRKQVERLWRSGRLLSSCLSGDDLFPRKLTLKTPRASEIAERYGDVREWIAKLQAGSRHYRLVRSEVNNRLLGANSLPTEAWVDNRDDALSLIGKKREAATFDRLVAMTRERQPELLTWLEKRPLEALELAAEWPRLLAVVEWLRLNPRPNIYLRQIDIVGVDTKFIEGRKRVLAELLDLALPAASIEGDNRGAAGFEARYGFLGKPRRLRFRLLDPALSPLLPTMIEGDQATLDLDVTLPVSVASALRLPAERVFITENEVNFLAFPAVPDSLVIFGGGYGLDSLKEFPWLADCDVHYWGDIDTHGFAILDQLRSYLPGARSLLMDRETFLAHREQWGREKRPETRDLARLNAGEAALFDDLRQNRLGDRLRLEQELVDYTRLQAELRRT